MFPKISIIIPVYNADMYVRQCLDSVVRQTYTNLQILIVDDGSFDSSYDICKEYEKKDKRIELYRTKNNGLSAARNFLLEKANGQYLSFIDSDDYIELDMYEKLISKIKLNNCSYVLFRANKVKNSKIVGTLGENNKNDDEIDDSYNIGLKILKDEIGSQVWKFLYPIEAFESIRFPVGLKWEDLHVTYLVLMSYPGKILVINDLLYNYRLNNNGISLGKDTKKSYYIFKGFENHLIYCRERNIELSGLLLQMTAKYAFSALIKTDKKHIKEICEIEKFLDENKNDILGEKYKEIKAEIMKFAYYKARGVFNLFSKVYKIIK